MGSHARSGLAAAGIAAFRGERLVLRDVDLQVPPGGATLLLGANGSGKSTLLRVLAGLKRPDAGTIHWNGVDTVEEPAPVAYLGHLDAIKLALTVCENLRLSGPSLEPALAAMDLEPLRDLPGRLLSAGQRRRLALARLALRPPGGLWLLDEPTLGLDAASVARLGALFAEHRRAGGAIVTATHLPLPLEDVAELHL
ncbi:MAG: heme ABC exporter ATP-binding protein CcmA [Acetobacteraceae bacterium]|nr:heme ABC exporter ATP-binding protein CcmA [Acetobacteraceae bacterium]